jgi:hypothetical protein
MADKVELARKIHELSKALEAHGTINGDDQAMFLSQSITLILHASQKAEHALILSRYLHRASGDLLALCEGADLQEVLSERAKEDFGSN